MKPSRQVLFIDWETGETKCRPFMFEENETPEQAWRFQMACAANNQRYRETKVRESAYYIT